MKGSRYLVFSISFLFMISMAPQALAVYTNATIEGTPPDKIKKVVLVLPGNEEKELRSSVSGSWVLESDRKLSIGTTGAVRVTDDDGNVTGGRFEVTPGGIAIRLNAGTPRDRSARTGPSLKVSVSNRETELGDKNAGLGTVRRTFGEFSIGYAELRYSGEEYEVEATDLGNFTIGETPFKLDAGFSYYNPSTETDKTSIPVGGDMVAITYPWAASNGSTGLIFGGAPGANVVIEGDYTEWSARIGLTGNHRGIGKSDWSWRPRLGLSYDHREQEIDGDFTSPTFGATIRAMNDQELTDNFIGIDLGITFSRPGLKFYDHQQTPIEFNVTGLITPGYQRSRLDGYMQTWCTPCAPPEDSLRFNYDDKDSGFAWRAELSVGLDAQLTDDLGIGVYAGYRYNDHIAVAENRRSPAYPIARLGDDEQTDFRLGLTLTYAMD